MTVTTTYTCDRCQKPQKGRHENGGYPPLWVIRITCHAVDNPSDYITPALYQQADLCNNCIKELGIRRPLHAPVIEPDAPTLDSIIRAIVQQEIQQGN